MSKETIEKIAEEFVRQPQRIDEDISINFISKINSKSSTQIEYCMHQAPINTNIIYYIILMYYLEVEWSKHIFWHLTPGNK